MRKTEVVSKTTHYRRIRQAHILGCPVDQLPDMRGRHTDNRPRGNMHYRWNDERMVSAQGHIIVRVGRTHLLADPNGYAKEHELVMVTAILRLLNPGEVIHHKDGNKKNNQIDNLILMSNADHVRLHDATRERNNRGQFI
jgi:hypothetical protein